MSVFTDKNGDIMGDSSRASNTAMSRSGRLSRSVVSSSSSGRQESVLAGDGRFQLFTKLGAGAFGQVCLLPKDASPF
ncbi:hypothetical protein DIPPA_28878 [Diplonema papillatum]|nr:hypothetical protein DIPPA_28878 [Diplonema papillatum]